MALFESYERREKQILDVLAQYDIKSIEECREICQAKGFDLIKLLRVFSQSVLKMQSGLIL